MPNPSVPTSLKVLRGSARQHPERINRREPHPPTGKTVAPPWLPTEGAAVDAWNRLLPHVEGMQVMTDADAEALALGCLALADYLDARNEEDGWRKADSAWKRYANALGWFGLNPSARSKVQTVQQATEDPLERWAAR